ncbi:MAG: cysteine--tRNA ligase [Planctomycetota bacterium]|nr:MAG: cysteine--tRNA ligase [Planctomycetota bacterium]
MPIVLYNTLSRKKETFLPLKENQVSMYHCGPTVYDRPHIGNYRAFLFPDLLRRFFEYKGYQVKQVMNLTDVDDKIIQRTHEENTTLQELTQRYIQAFFEELKLLNVQPAHHYPKATEHIPQMVRLVETLKKKGLAYESNGSVYFSIKNFPHYGRLSHLDLRTTSEVSRISQDEYSKESPQDFALWKAWTPKDKNIFWQTSLGKGRPGWHLECSAMSMEYLGESFDIHTGGIDLIFPHHENEIAQSEGASGKPFVKYWLHNEHFLLNGQKISKSLGNVLTLPELLEQGYNGAVIRYALICQHYRKRFNLDTTKSMQAAHSALEKLVYFRQDLESIQKKGEPHSEILQILHQSKDKFNQALEDDLNLPVALAALFELIKRLPLPQINQQEAKAILEFLTQADQVLGVIDFHIQHLYSTVDKKRIESLIHQRTEARRQKDFDTADRIREQLLNLGVLVQDLPNGTKWRIKGGKT